ncbi:MAG: hypothetical protein M3443_15885 [Actinomycetota bacterium]|nr:hypothetical protein [Actinomycetota bacterium]
MGVRAGSLLVEVPPLLAIVGIAVLPPEGLSRPLYSAQVPNSALANNRELLLARRLHLWPGSALSHCLPLILSRSTAVAHRPVPMFLIVSRSSSKIQN